MFSVKETIATATLAPFEFEDSQGEKRELPHLKLLSVDHGQRLLGGDGLAVLEEIGAEPELIEEMNSWPLHATEALFQAWVKHSDVRVAGGAPGKSPSASPSSRSTGTSSRRTSGSGASRSRR